MRFLIADDDPVARKLITSTLEAYGKVTEVCDGAQALEAFEDSVDSSDPFSLIVLDISMPEVDGLDVLAAIRVLEEQRGIVGSNCVKTIIITGYSDVSSIYDAHALECNSYLLKPLDCKKLITETMKLGLVLDSKSVN